MLPPKKSNRWFALGLLHALLAVLLFLVPTGLAGTVKIAPGSVTAFAILFSVLTVLIALAGRAGKLWLWLSTASGFTLAVLVWMIWMVQAKESFLALGVFLSGLFFVIPGLTILGLIIGLVLQKKMPKPPAEDLS